MAKKLLLKRGQAFLRQVILQGSISITSVEGKGSKKTMEGWSDQCLGEGDLERKWVEKCWGDR
jgi:hypothetical protein